MALEFCPDDAEFNRANALYLAHASDVAYLRSPGVEAWQRLGLIAIPFRHKVTRTRGFLGVCNTHAVLAFRGSDPVTLPNWITDSVVRLVERDHYDGRVHLGFASALKRSWPTLSTLLDEIEDKPVFLTGHSMGGALAVLTACRLSKLGKPATATYTFGSPRVGNSHFCSGYDLPTYRVVNRLDLVPEMPMASMRRFLPKRPRLGKGKILGKLQELADRVPCYDHVKTLVYMDHDGMITVGGDVERWTFNAMTRAIATRGKSFHEGISDHLISNYIGGLQGKTRKQLTRVRRRIKVD